MESLIRAYYTFDWNVWIPFNLRLCNLFTAHIIKCISFFGLNDNNKKIRYFFERLIFHFTISRYRTVVRLGDLDLDPDVNDGAMPVNVQIERIITHEKYNHGGKIINDIALLKLKQTVTFNSKYFVFFFLIIIKLLIKNNIGGVTTILTLIIFVYCTYYKSVWF